MAQEERDKISQKITALVEKTKQSVKGTTNRDLLIELLVRQQFSAQEISDVREQLDEYIKETGILVVKASVAIILILAAISLLAQYALSAV